MGVVVHHNVFDNQYLQTAAMHVTAGITDARFSDNTVVMRQKSWRDGVFSFDEGGFEHSTIAIERNIFVSTYPLGDRLGGGLGSAHFADNDFYNIDGSGASALAADPRLSLTGGFPSAYVPARGSPAARLGAFADGTWSVGPRRRAGRAQTGRVRPR